MLRALFSVEEECHFLFADRMPEEFAAMVKEGILSEPDEQPLMP